MGASYSDEEAVFNVLTGLPLSSVWQLFHTQLEQCMHDSFSATVISSALTGSGNPITASFQMNALMFKSCMACITAEASRMVNIHSASVSGPGSKYANSASTASASNVNSITRLRKHKNNFQGIFCLTTRCGHRDHDKEHCYHEGGGMAGQAPWQQKKKKETAAVASSTPPVPSTSMPVPAPTIAALATHTCDLSCASIKELPDEASDNDILAIAHALSTILDSGTTSTLIIHSTPFRTCSSSRLGD
ncbi:hypothetical protein BDR03DRAFT_1010556 [Suillus americanus]|nr:hypothetical protein BDR03DRAFT_1010556 [Suillus americanus]